jgi:hypothetical protein
MRPIALDKYPVVPRPLTVDWRVESKIGVLISPRAEERYPVVPNPLTVDVSCAEEIYPKVPKPRVVDVRFVEVTSPVPEPVPSATLFKYNAPFDRTKLPKFAAPISRNKIELVCKLLVIA